MKRFLLLLMTCSMASTLSAQIPNYVIDDTFNSGDFYIKGGVNSILVHQDGHLLVVGTFTNNSEAHNYSMISENGNILIQNVISSIGVGGSSNHFYGNEYITCGVDLISLLNDDLGTNHSFEFEYQKSAYNGFLGNDALDAMVEPDNSILVGGRFFTDSINHNNIESLRQLCRVDSTGAPNPDFPMLHCADPIDAKIYTMDTLSDGSLIVSGSFYDFGGYPYNHIGKLNSDFSVDTTFVNSFEPGGEAYINYIDSDDRIWLQLYGINSNTGTLGNGYALVRLLPNGELDTTFTIPSVVLPLDPFNRGYITDIAELPNEKYILTGQFYSVNGYSRMGIVMLNEDGSVVQEVFENLGADEAIWGNYDEPPFVGVIEILDEGKLLIGGQFSSFGGEPYSCLVRLKPDGFVGVDEKNPNKKLNIYPNPANNSIRVNLPEENQNLEQLHFFDLSGRQVLLVDHPMAGAPIDISGLSSGLYLLEGRTEKGVFSGKVVVE